MAARAGAVEPELDQVAVVAGKLLELGVVVGVVGDGVFVAGIVAIPRRKVDAELEAMTTGGGGHIADDVALPVLEGARLDGVSGLLGRPENEAVVMLGDQDDVPGAGGLNGVHPLIGIEVDWVEDFRVGGAVTPLAIEEGVGRKVEDDAELEVLPDRLLRGRLEVG